MLVEGEDRKLDGKFSRNKCVGEDYIVEGCVVECCVAGVWERFFFRMLWSVPEVWRGAGKKEKGVLTWNSSRNFLLTCQTRDKARDGDLPCDRCQDFEGLHTPAVSRNLGTFPSQNYKPLIKYGQSDHNSHLREINMCKKNSNSLEWETKAIVKPGLA